MLISNINEAAYQANQNTNIHAHLDCLNAGDSFVCSEIAVCTIARKYSRKHNIEIKVSYVAGFKGYQVSRIS